MKNKKTIFNPIKAVGILVFLMAFTLNIQTSLNGEWELVNVGFAQTCTGEGCSGSTEGNDHGNCFSKPSNVTCEAGGSGASSCSIEYEVLGVKKVASVTCSVGCYACCYSVLNGGGASCYKP